MMCKLKGGCKRGHYDVQIQRTDAQRTLLCANYEVDAKGAIMKCNLKGRIDKGGHYDVEMKVRMQKWALSCAN